MAVPIDLEFLGSRNSGWRPVIHRAARTAWRGRNSGWRARFFQDGGRYSQGYKKDIHFPSHHRSGFDKYLPPLGIGFSHNNRWPGRFEKERPPLWQNRETVPTV